MASSDPAGRGARTLLDRPAPDDYLSAWTTHAAKPRLAEQRNWHTAIVFRLGVERLALPATAVREVAEPRPLHTLPHRRGTPVLGIINVRGELIVCVDLPKALGFTADASPAGDGSRSHARFLVLRRDTTAVACPVDDVLGVHRFFDADLKNVPSTIAKATSRYSQHVFEWQGQPVGYLDEQLVFATLKRSLA